MEHESPTALSRVRDKVLHCVYSACICPRPLGHLRLPSSPTFTFFEISMNASIVID